MPELYALFAVSTATLVWRTLLGDYPHLQTWLEKVPVLGAALICGFCSTLWFSLAALYVLQMDIPQMFGTHPLISFVAYWFAFSGGVLLLRNLTIVLMDGGAVLKHMHKKQHS